MSAVKSRAYQAWDDVPHEDWCPAKPPVNCECCQDCECMRRLVLDARSWARHGYEIGQRSCTWSDHGVAPSWLVSGHGEATTPMCVTMGHEDAPAVYLGTYDDGDTYELRVRYCVDCARQMAESGQYVITGFVSGNGDSGEVRHG